MLDINEKLLAALKQNARKSNLSLAKELGVSEGTIRKHLHDLVAKKVIERFTVIVRQEASALIAIKTASGMNTTLISTEIKRITQGTIFEVAGTYDIICFIHAENLDRVNELVEKIRALKGVIETQTVPVLKEV